VYRLTVENVTKRGEVTVTPKKTGYAFQPAFREVTVYSYMPFSGLAGTNGTNGIDSHIDRIRAAKAAGLTEVIVEVKGGNEALYLDNNTDLKETTGLVLDDLDTPARVIIKGWGWDRTLDLQGAGGKKVPLITVKSTITLTLTDGIIIKGLKNGEIGDSGDSGASVIKVDGGTLVLENNAVIADNGGGPQRAGGCTWLTPRLAPSLAAPSR
jgi:hypothetical protein